MQNDSFTHQVLNQPSPLENYNAYSSDTVLQSYVNKFDGDWGTDKLITYGELVGGDLLQAGFAANKYKPEFQSHDRFGHRIDQINYHPAYHQLMSSAINAGHHSLPWKENKKGAHVVRAAIEYLHYQADPGSGCPLTMTFSSVPALKHQSNIANEWLPKILANTYDPRNIPFFEKEGVTIGMAMTEKQGGSDVRANTSFAKPTNQVGGGMEYELTGHKWFCSAPMCDAFLVLAQTGAGLSCFLMPRWRPDGHKNTVFIQRLKDKMGNVSNASSEIEFKDAFAWLIGEEGKGVKTILEMVAMTRFDCMVGSSALMGLATAQAIHHTSGREVFGKNLHQQALMQNVLSDLAIESEASLAVSMRLAKALDNQQDEHERNLLRLGTAIGKFWICKRSSSHVVEAMECVGGVGVVEDNVLARLYREAPINAIWEGSGNVQCLDVARAISKSPQILDSFINELEKANGNFPQFDRKLLQFKQSGALQNSDEFALRYHVEQLAVLWQAASLITYSENFVAEAFVLSRLADSPSHMFGGRINKMSSEAVIKRAQAKL